jgi:polar amino acid transport system permease protein
MLDIDFMIEILPRVLKASLVTLEISFLSLFFSVTLGLIFSIIALTSGKLINILIRCFVEFTRGVPQLVQISIIYFALPYIGIYFDEFWTGVVALSFIGAGYTVEIFRNAVLNVNKGQHEAGKILGLSNYQTLIYVLYPQIIKRSLPPITNELINVVKASALLSVISVNELTKIMNDVIFEYFVVIEVLLEATIMYLLIISVLVSISRYFEKRLIV